MGPSSCPIPHSDTSLPWANPWVPCFSFVFSSMWNNPRCVCEFSESLSTHSHAELSLWQRHLSKMTLQSSMPPGTVTDAFSGTAVQAAEDRWGCWLLLRQLAAEKGVEDQDRDKLQLGHLLQPALGWACPTAAPHSAWNWSRPDVPLECVLGTPV